MQVELRQMIGKYSEPTTGKVCRVGWDIDFVLLDGKAVATINRVPGAAVGLYAGVQLTQSQKAAVEEAVATARGGTKPSKIGGPVDVPFELLDDEDDLVIPATLEVNDGASNE
jgi:hypothetical protein